MKLEQQIREFTDEYCLDQYLNHNESYTPQAQQIFRNELQRRGYSDEMIRSKKEAQSTSQAQEEQMHALVHPFSNTDILLAKSVLDEHDIHYLIKSTSFESSALPIENQAAVEYMMYVPESEFNKASQAIDEVFIPQEGKYRQRASTLKEKLQSINFSDLVIPQEHGNQEFEIEFSAFEKEKIIEYARTVQQDAVVIEQRMQRPVFFLDHLDDLVTKLQSAPRVSLSIPHILAVLELLQIYSSVPDFADELEETAGQLLQFFKLG